MSSQETPSMTIFTFGNNPQHGDIMNAEVVDYDPDTVENEDAVNIMCIILKGIKLGCAYYNPQDKMVSKYGSYFHFILMITRDVPTSNTKMQRIWQFSKTSSIYTKFLMTTMLVIIHTFTIKYSNSVV